MRPSEKGQENGNEKSTASTGFQTLLRARRIECEDSHEMASVAGIQAVAIPQGTSRESTFSSLESFTFRTIYVDFEEIIAV